MLWLFDRLNLRNYAHEVIYDVNLAIDGEVDNFVLSVKYFTIDQGNDVCTLSGTPGKNIHIILSVLY